jgi:YVTN family beta-propeller protein
VSPRYIHFVNSRKAYITDLYAKAITIVDPVRLVITGRIDVNNHSATGNQHSTEQMVTYHNFVFTNCWSNDNKILVIDTQTDRLADSIEVKQQPVGIVLDKNNKLWTLTDGGGKNPESPALVRIDAGSRLIEKVFLLKPGTRSTRICMNGTADTVYYISNDVWQIPVNARNLPNSPFIQANSKLFYGIAIDPETSEVYISDALDYSQNGMVYRYSPKALPLDTFKVGINPGAFCFK